MLVGHSRKGGGLLIGGHAAGAPLSPQEAVAGSPTAMADDAPGSAVAGGAADDRDMAEEVSQEAQLPRVSTAPRAPTEAARAEHELQ